MERIASAPTRKSRPIRVGLITIGVLFLLFTLLGNITFPALFIYHMSVGWIRHFLTVTPSLKPDFLTITLSLIAGTMAIAMLQRFLRVTISPLWPIKRTVLTVGIFLGTTAAAIIMTGVVHQLVWLLRSPIISNRGKAMNRTQAIHNGKQIHLALLEMANDGIYPASLGEIRPYLDHYNEILTYQPSDSSSVREPFLFLRPGEDITLLAPGTPVLAALGFDGGKCVIVRADGSVEAPLYKSVESLLQPE